MVEYKDLSIKDSKLWYGNKDTDFKLERDLTHKHMYWITFPNGNKSDNFYSLTNASDNIKCYFINKSNTQFRRGDRGSTEPAGALF